MKTNASPILLSVCLLLSGAAQAGGGIARVQVIHNCADLAASSVDIWLDNALLIDNFAFRTASPFIDAPAGVQFTVGVAPSTSTASTDAIFQQNFTLVSGETYVIVASGIVSSSGYSPLTGFSLEVFAQGRETASGGPLNTDVLVFHGATDAPTVDVYESSIPAGTLVNDASYGDFAGYLPLGTADYTIEVRTADNSTAVAAYSAPLATLGLGGAALTVLASGFLDPSVNSNGPAFGLWVALATGGALIPLPSAAIPTARVQVIHNCADLAASSVDVWLNNTLLLDNFDFRTASPFVDLQAGPDLTVGIALPNSVQASDAIFQETYNLESGGSYIIVASGIVSGSGYSPAPAFSLEVFDAAREAAVGGSMMNDVLVFHGCTDAPTVDVAETAVLAGATLVDDLSYTDFQGYLSVPTDDYALQVQTAGGVPIITYLAPLSNLGLGGAAITVLASGFLDPAMNSNGPAFGLWVALASGGDLVELPIATGVTENDLLESATAFPNPAQDAISVRVTTKEQTRTDLSISDASGRIVAKRTGLLLAQGENTISIPVSDLASGSYRLTLAGAEVLRTIPVQIAR